MQEAEFLENGSIRPDMTDQNKGYIHIQANSLTRRGSYDIVLGHGDRESSPLFGCEGHNCF